MNHHKSVLEKLRSADELAKQADQWKSDGKKIVFTNGCFDILHKGHIDYLTRAADLGDCLVVGINSDESVTRLKGENRPLQDESSRSYLMASLECVSTVVVFTEDTPMKLIELVKPAILVKGGDYTPKTVVGAEFVYGYGGRVEIIPFLEGYSTSAIEQKIIKGSIS